MLGRRIASLEWQALLARPLQERGHGRWLGRRTDGRREASLVLGSGGARAEERRAVQDVQPERWRVVPAPSQWARRVRGGSLLPSSARRVAAARPDRDRHATHRLGPRLRTRGRWRCQVLGGLPAPAEAEVSLHQSARPLGLVLRHHHRRTNLLLGEPIAESAQASASRFHVGCTSLAVGTKGRASEGFLSRHSSQPCPTRS